MKKNKIKKNLKKSVKIYLMGYKTGQNNTKRGFVLERKENSTKIQQFEDQYSYHLKLKTV